MVDSEGRVLKENDKVQFNKNKDPNTKTEINIGTISGFLKHSRDVVIIDEDSNIKIRKANTVTKI